MNETKLRALIDAGFDAAAMPGNGRYLLAARDGFAALIDIATGQAGSAGMVTEQGLAIATRSGDQVWFAAKGARMLATADQAAGLAGFQFALSAALQDGR